MNFLAHLFLSGPDHEILVGNFLGDFVPNRDLPSYPPGVRAGIQLHRRIDAFTDRHPAVLRGVRRLYPFHRRYGAVIIDVYYDHLLALNWERYSEESFPDFRERVYEALLRGRSLMPEALRGRVERMTAADWLASYAGLEGIAQSIARMQRRASRPEWLEDAVVHLREHKALYNEEFQAFFPEAIALVERELDQPSK